MAAPLLELDAASDAVLLFGPPNGNIGRRPCDRLTCDRLASSRVLRFVCERLVALGRFTCDLLELAVAELLDSLASSSRFFSFALTDSMNFCAAVKSDREARLVCEALREVEADPDGVRSRGWPLPSLAPGSLLGMAEAGCTSRPRPPKPGR